MRHGKYRLIISFLALPVALYAVFVIWPYAQAFYLSITDWRGLSSQARVVGFDNYVRLVHDTAFWPALKHNAYLLIALPLITIGLGLFFASMLNVGGRSGRAAVQGVRGARVYQVVYFFPQVLSISIIAILWQFAYNPNSGLVNGFLRVIGLGSVQPVWLGDPKLVLWAVLAVMVWSNVGFYVVLFSAGMQSIPRDLYEAALLDGAGRGATFFRVTLPLLWDTVQVAWVYLGIVALDAFATIQIMTNNEGGPSRAADVLSLSLYRNAFDYSNFGYACAMGVTLFFLTLTMAVVTMRLSRRERIEF